MHGTMVEPHDVALQACLCNPWSPVVGMLREHGEAQGHSLLRLFLVIRHSRQKDPVTAEIVTAGSSKRGLLGTLTKMSVLCAQQ